VNDAAWPQATTSPKKGGETVSDVEGTPTSEEPQPQEPAAEEPTTGEGEQPAAEPTTAEGEQPAEEPTTEEPAGGE
jgi:hypothetical protein